MNEIQERALRQLLASVQQVDWRNIGPHSWQEREDPNANPITVFSEFMFITCGFVMRLFDVLALLHFLEGPEQAFPLFARFTALFNQPAPDDIGKVDETGNESCSKGLEGLLQLMAESEKVFKALIEVFRSFEA